VKPDGKHVSEDGEERGEGLGAAHGSGGHKQCAHQSSEPDSGAALEHVEEKCGGAQAFAARAENVSCSDVAAPDGANVLVQKQAHEQVSGGNGSEQISGGHDQQACKEHDE
jgi:hypothetical protein